MGSVQEYRTSTWNAASGNVWNSVQNSAAWPINQPQQMSIKTQKNMQKHSSMIGPQPTAFQWSSSWDPLMNSQPRMSKKSMSQNSSYTAPSTLKKEKKSMPAPISAPVSMNGAPHYDIQLIPAYTIAQPIHPMTHVQQQPDLSPPQMHESIMGPPMFDYGSPEANLAAMNAYTAANGKKKKKSTEEKQLIEDELSKQNLYKTELCRSFCETGMCRYGHKCQFAHGEHELRPVMRHPKYKTETCKTYSNTGTCPYGNRCRFVHPGVTFGSWDDNTLITGMIPLASVDGLHGLIGVMDQLSISPSSIPMSHYHHHPGMSPMMNQQNSPQQQQMVYHSQVVQETVEQVQPQIQKQPLPSNNNQQQTQTSNAVAAPQTPSTADATVPSPAGTIELKDKESEVKALVDDEDSDNKPRLAFFQNLTVI